MYQITVNYDDGTEEDFFSDTQAGFLEWITLFLHCKNISSFVAVASTKQKKEDK